MLANSMVEMADSADDDDVAAAVISVIAFYPRDAMLARVFAIATCLSVRPSVRLSHAGIVPSRAKAGS